MIGCQRGGDWSRRGSLLTRFEKTSDRVPSDRVLLLVVVTFDQVGIDLADVVSDGVTENGKALVVVSSMPMQFLHLKIVCQKVYIFFENSFLWHVKKIDKYWLLCFIRSCPRKRNCFGVEYFKLKL